MVCFQGANSTAWPTPSKDLVQMVFLTAVYRGDVANTVIKKAGSEVNLFKDRVEVTHIQREARGKTATVDT
jgi:hypothetical protein